MKILFISATPNNQPFLQSKREYKQIEANLKNTPSAGSIEIICSWNTEAPELTSLLIDILPDIIHFSGHGLPLEFVFIDKNGQAKTTPFNSMYEIIKISQKRPRLIVLNCCYSDEEANRMSKLVDFAIGVNQEIGDEAAVIFASRFYHYLGLGYSVKESFDLALIDLELNGIKGELIKLFSGSNIDVNNIYLVDNVYRGNRILVNREIWNDFVTVLEFAKKVHHIYQTLDIQNLEKLRQYSEFGESKPAATRLFELLQLWKAYMQNVNNLMGRGLDCDKIRRAYERLKQIKYAVICRLFIKNEEYLANIVMDLDDFDQNQKEIADLLGPKMIENIIISEQGREKIGIKFFHLRQHVQNLITNSDELIRRLLDILTETGGADEQR